MLWRELTDHRGERAVYFAAALIVLTFIVTPLGSGAPAVVPIYAASEQPIPGIRSERLVERMRDLGVIRFMYTDIERVGTMQGPNLDMLADLNQLIEIIGRQSNPAAALADDPLPVEARGVAALGQRKDRGVGIPAADLPPDAALRGVRPDVQLRRASLRRRRTAAG